MTVDHLTTERENLYTRFLLSQPDTLFYASLRYRDFLRQLTGCGEEYLVVMEGGEIRGALPLMYHESSRGRVYNSLPYYGSNGGVIGNDPRACRALVEAYDEIATRDCTISSTLIGNPFQPQDCGQVVHNFTDSRIAQYTPLTDEREPWATILARIDGSARRNVKKAQSEGVEVEVDWSQWERLRELHQENIRSIGGLPKTDEFFSLVPRCFEAGEEYDLYIARKDGEVVAGLLVFYFNRTVEYFTPATHVDFRAAQPLSLILIQAMADASRRGYRRWNWGGTWLDQAGVYRFKRKWGAQEAHYHYYTQLNRPEILDRSPESIVSDFANFYVVPFSALRSGGSHE